MTLKFDLFQVVKVRRRNGKDYTGEIVGRRLKGWTTYDVTLRSGVKLFDVAEAAITADDEGKRA